jgi:hypothetical protein
MIKEILEIPQRYLIEVVEIIRLGIEYAGDDIPSEIKAILLKWCDNKDEYINVVLDESIEILTEMIGNG